jgi:hypothetical protein
MWWIEKKIGPHRTLTLFCPSDSKVGRSQFKEFTLWMEENDGGRGVNDSPENGLRHRDTAEEQGGDSPTIRHLLCDLD